MGENNLDRPVPEYFSTIAKEFVYGIRSLIRNPSFAIVSVLTLALGVAANTTIFSVVNAVLVRKPPVNDPDRVTVLLSRHFTEESADSPGEPASLPDLQFWRAQNQSFDEIATVRPAQDFTLSGFGSPENLAVSKVSTNFFHVVGVPASLGRTFVPREETPGENRVAIISDGLWRSHFGSDPAVLQKIVRLDSEPYTVIGVMPPKFKLGSFPADIWIPLPVDPVNPLPEQAQSRSFYAIARLAEHSTLERAQSEMSTIAQQLEKQVPADKGWGVRILSLQEFQIRDMNSRKPLLILMLAVGLVLIISCANVAGLLLARAAAREQEFSMRTALGARRRRLIRQLLVELLPLALLGSGSGLALGAAGVSVLRKAIAYNDQLAAIQLEVDWRVVVFTIAVSVLCVLLFGLVPTLQLSKSQAIAGNVRTITSGRRRRWKRRVLLTSQIALSLILSTGASLAILALLDEMQSPLGFNPNQVLVAGVTLPQKKYVTTEQQAAFYERVLEQLQSTPGVKSASVSEAIPAAAEAPSVEVRIEGQEQLSKTGGFQSRLYVVSQGYFATMEIPLIQGRLFASSDNSKAPPVVLVNSAFVKRFFPDENAIGHFVSIVEGASPPTWRQIIGTVGNVADSVGLQAVRPQIYENYSQAPAETMTIAVRAERESEQLPSLVRQTIWSLDPDLALKDVMSMSEVIDVKGGKAGDRLLAELLTTFALVAVILTTVGVYGVVLSAANQRTREIGVRIALGADKFHVACMILAEGGIAAGIGLALGCLVAFPLPSLFSNLFEGFHATAAPIILVVSLLLTGVTFAASVVPMRMATRVDPASVLRQD